MWRTRAARNPAFRAAFAHGAPPALEIDEKNQETTACAF
jgi:hypothetical protein